MAAFRGEPKVREMHPNSILANQGGKLIIHQMKRVSLASIGATGSSAVPLSASGVTFSQVS